MTATLFDFDGVLVDSEPTHFAAFNDVLAMHGLAISEKEYQDTIKGLTAQINQFKNQSNAAPRR